MEKRFDFGFAGFELRFDLEQIFLLRQDVFLERLELHDGNFSPFVSLLKRVKRLLQIRFDIGFVVFQLVVRGFVADKGVDEFFLN